MIIADNYVEIFIYSLFISYYRFILQLQLTFNNRVSEIVQNLSIYRVLNQFSRTDILDKYFSIFIYSSFRICEG